MNNIDPNKIYLLYYYDDDEWWTDKWEDVEEWLKKPYTSWGELKKWDPKKEKEEENDLQTS